MAENVNNSNNSTERTFSQDDVNAIVEDRLGRERKKYADYEELKAKAEKYDAEMDKKKTDLQKEKERADAAEAKLQSYTKAEQARQIRENVGKEKGIPAHLLTGTTEEECRQQADALLDWNKPKYPQTRKAENSKQNPNSEDGDSYREWARSMFGE